MTDQQAYEFLQTERPIIATNLDALVREARSAKELATRVIVWCDSEDVRAMIEMAARWVLEREVERRLYF
jgi:hypothetical protein